jgi:hypothetical protein
VFDLTYAPNTTKSSAPNLKLNLTFDSALATIAAVLRIRQMRVTTQRSAPWSSGVIVSYRVPLDMLQRREGQDKKADAGCYRWLVIG